MKWGPWSMNEKHLTLDHKDGYEVSFKGTDSSAEVLDWIFQIQAKTWADAPTLVNLLAAFDDVLHPQENYCSMGVDKKANGEALARQYVANPNAREEMYKKMKGTDV